MLHRSNLVWSPRTVRAALRLDGHHGSCVPVARQVMSGWRCPRSSAQCGEWRRKCAMPFCRPLRPTSMMAFKSAPNQPAPPPRQRRGDSPGQGCAGPSWADFRQLQERIDKTTPKASSAALAMACCAFVADQAPPVSRQLLRAHRVREGAQGARGPLAEAALLRRRQRHPRHGPAPESRGLADHHEATPRTPSGRQGPSSSRARSRRAQPSCSRASTAEPQPGQRHAHLRERVLCKHPGRGPSRVCQFLCALVAILDVGDRVACVGSGTDVSTGDFVGRCGVPDRRSNLEPGLLHFQPGEPWDTTRPRACSPEHFGTYGYQTDERVDEAASGHRLCTLSHTPGKDRAVGSLRSARGPF